MKSLRVWVRDDNIALPFLYLDSKRVHFESFFQVLDWDSFFFYFKSFKKRAKTSKKNQIKKPTIFKNQEF